MSKNISKISAPGKLFLSGEWAVLEVGNPGIVAAVNKRVFAEVGPAKTNTAISVTIEDFGINDLGAKFDGKSLEWERELTDKEKQDTLFIRASIDTALQYIGQGKWKPFSIRSWGKDTQIEVDGKIKKVGFGSSAASVVAATTAILNFNGAWPSGRKGNDLVYKLSTIAHYLAQGKVGSAFDVAASTYGGVFVYKRFDPAWLLDQMAAGKSVREVCAMQWPGFVVEELKIPKEFRLLVGWTKESASTPELVKKLSAWAAGNKVEYKRLYGLISTNVRELMAAWKEGDKKKILEFIMRNEDILRELGEKSGVKIETPGLRLLSRLAHENGGAGKLSGAGGGDCGIGVCFDAGSAEKITKAWKSNGLCVIDATVDREGVREE